MQNVFYKNYNEPAGGALHTVVGIGEPAPPQHWEDREGAEAIRGQGTGEEGQLPGLQESCIGTWGWPQAQRTGRMTEAGSGKPSLQCGNRGHLHHAPTLEHVCAWRPSSNIDTQQGGLWHSVGVLSPLPQPRGPRKEQLGAVAMLPPPAPQ